MHAEKDPALLPGREQHRCQGSNSVRSVAVVPHSSPVRVTRVTHVQTLNLPGAVGRILLSMRRRVRHLTIMLSRRALPLLIPGAFFALCAPEAAFAAPARELFTLSRSTNANVVKYAVRLDKAGLLDVHDPVDAYWLMLAENGRREELTWGERHLAYGFSASSVTPYGCALRLTACRERELSVRWVEGRFHAELKIQQRTARLQSIFVRAEEHSLLPSVRYVEIAGVTAVGQRIAERILPKRVSRF